MGSRCACQNRAQFRLLQRFIGEIRPKEAGGEAKQFTDTSAAARLSPLKPAPALSAWDAWPMSDSRRMVRWPCCRSGSILPWYGRFLLQRRRKFSRWMTLPFWSGCIITSVIASAISLRRVNAPVFLSRSNTLTPVTACRVVLVGNAAQTLHPVAGQGFNLGLRDAWELAEEIVASPLDIGTPAMLARYRDKRRMDSGVGRVFTDSLVRLFSNDNLVLGAMRGLGLSALDCLPQAKRFVARRMMFGARG